MNSVTTSRAINSPVGDVWALWADFGNVFEWHPFVSHSYLLGDADQPVGVGTRRQCDMTDGKNSVREEIVEFEPEQKMQVSVYEGTMPLKSALGTIRFSPLSGARTRLEIRMDFEPKFGLIGRLMAPMMRRQFRGMFTQMLETTETEVRARRTADERRASETVDSVTPIVATS